MRTAPRTELGGVLARAVAASGGANFPAQKVQQASRCAPMVGHGLQRPASSGAASPLVAQSGQHGFGKLAGGSHPGQAASLGKDRHHLGKVEGMGPGKQRLAA